MPGGFDFQAPLDVDALTRAVTAFVRRHDTFWTWFRADDDGAIVRHIVDPEVIEFRPQQHGDYADPAEIRAHVQAQTPGPFDWDCFTFGAIETDDGSLSTARSTTSTPTASPRRCRASNS
ncbi:SL659 acyltransferase papA1 [Gordonia bronchialis]|nr:SL659 acyltransferase papA1 [Gordonia bronchialis]